MSRRFPNPNPFGAQGSACNISNSHVQLGPHNVLNVLNQPRRSQPSQSQPSQSQPRMKEPKKPLTKSEREPTRDQLDHISLKIDKYKPTAWKDLGEKLGLSKGEVEIVEHDYHREGTAESCYQMLRKWKERSPTPPQLKVLAQALCDIGRGDLSDYLAS